jgi:hypothetical protein
MEGFFCAACRIQRPGGAEGWSGLHSLNQDYWYSNSELQTGIMNLIRGLYSGNTHCLIFYRNKHSELLKS